MVLSYKGFKKKTDLIWAGKIFDRWCLELRITSHQETTKILPLLVVLVRSTRMLPLTFYLGFRHLLVIIASFIISLGVQKW